MLQLLHIENIAVIERADIELDKGLTVLSGETGAGKSIVIDSIGALLGKRVSRDLVRSGAQKGFVSAVFTDLPRALRELLDELALSGDEPDTLYVQRQISADGKSTCRVNMKPASAAVLRQLAPYLIDIHGQNDGQKLLDEAHHIEYLDGYAGCAEILERYRPKYQALVTLRREITALETGEQERLQRIDMLTFHKEEIEQAALKPDEDEALAQRKAYFDHAGKIAGALEQARMALSGDDEIAGACELLDQAASAIESLREVSDAFDGMAEQAGALEQARMALSGDDEIAGACELLDQAASAIESLREVSDAFDGMAEQAEEVRLLAADLRDSVASQGDNLDFSPAEREMVEQRLDEIYRLKQKYGGTIPEILVYLEKITAELDTLENADDRREELREQYRGMLAEAKGIAAELTEQRRKAAKQLEGEIVRELSELDMDKVKMRVAVRTGTKLSAHGCDTVTFEISVNPGEPEKPLSKVASGGELSRIMLALKNVLTAGEDVGMLIFDEIDTGVSGHAAQQIGRKLSAIAKKKQTLCVTHLPQIAAMGDHHLRISKSVRDGRSYTDVSPMDRAHRVDEIARLLSGEEISDAARRNAEELLDAAGQGA